MNQKSSKSSQTILKGSLKELLNNFRILKILLKKKSVR